MKAWQMGSKEGAPGLPWTLKADGGRGGEVGPSSGPQRGDLIHFSPQGAEVEGSKLLLQLKHPVHATPGYTKGPPGSQQPLRG